MIERVSLSLSLLACACHFDDGAQPASPGASPQPPLVRAASASEEDRATVVNEQAQPTPKIRDQPPSSPATRPAPPSPLPSLPSEIEVGAPQEFPMVRDRSLRITHAPATEDRAIVYLHGMCGNSKGADPWAGVAVDYGTLIVVRANVPCEDRPGFKWPKDIEAIQSRIDAALAETAQQRMGRLDTERVILFGYSQGANRAEKLAGLHPTRYPWVILGGTPAVAVPERLTGTRAVAFLGGELEDVSHMVAGVELLNQVHHPARFFLLPGVHHGNYGPAGPRVVREAFEYVLKPTLR